MNDRRLLRRATLGVVLLALTGCVRTQIVCTPAPVRDLMPEIVALVGAPRLVPDAAVPNDRVVGHILAQFQRGPIRGALVELDSLGTSTRTDSAGRFTLPIPAVDHAVLRARAIGYLMRRDTLHLASLVGHRLEIVLPDAYAFGDIEGMPCTKRRRRWPF